VLKRPSATSVAPPANVILPKRKFVLPWKACVAKRALPSCVALDKDGPATLDYRVTPGGDGVVLKPLEPGWPSIDYFAADRYWKQFGTDKVYPVQARKGVLGFDQFNSAVIIRDIRRYR
jgi:hypothetical protein